MNLHELGIHYGTDQATVHDYLRRLEPYFMPIKESMFTFVEIGVAEGASIRVWNDYFTNAAVIGVDNDPNCWMADVNFSRLKIIQGNAGSVEFWRDLKLNNLNVVIDDGSHRCHDIICAFEMLWPKLNPGGLYVIEDVHANWLPGNGLEWLAYFTNKLHSMHKNGAACAKQDRTKNDMDFMHFTKGLIIMGKL